MSGVLGASVGWAASATQPVLLVSLFEIKTPKNEVFTITQARSYQLGVLAKASFKTLVVAVPHIPQSVESVKRRAKDAGVSPSRVRTVTGPNGAIIYFETKEHFHVYSTRGGHLLISRAHRKDFDFSSLRLVPASGELAKRT